ncbi:unnamed protein product [Lampetra planeri]
MTTCGKAAEFGMMHGASTVEEGRVSTVQAVQLPQCPQDGGAEEPALFVALRFPGVGEERRDPRGSRDDESVSMKLH